MINYETGWKLHWLVGRLAAWLTEWHMKSRLTMGGRNAHTQEYKLITSSMDGPAAFGRLEGENLQYNLQHYEQQHQQLII